jgi:flagellar hook-length control protein FliK
MMGSAAPTLLAVAPAPAMPTVQGDAPATTGNDFLAELAASLSGAAAKSGNPLLGAQLTAVQVGEEPTTDEDMPLELAAMIAGLLPGMAVTPEDTPSLEAGSQSEGQLTDGDAAASGKGASGLLDLLQLRAAAALKDAGTTTAATATDLPDQPAAGAAPAPDAASLQTALVASTVKPAARADAPAPAAAPPVDLAAPTAQTPTTNFSATLSHLAATASTQQASNAQAPQAVHSAVGTPRWADEVSSRVVLMSLRGQTEGSLNLNPEHLGPLEVRISVKQNTANVWFGAQHADTRAALTEALPRLRELMSDAGLMLGHAGVSQEAPRQDARDAAASRAAAMESGGSIDGVESPSQPVVRRVALGLVDIYA